MKLKNFLGFLGLFIPAGVMIILLVIVWNMLAQRQLPSNPAATVPLARATPQPQPTRLPRVDGMPWPDNLATPAPGEQAAVVGVSERSAAAAQLTPTYILTSTYLSASGVDAQYVTNPQTGETIRLGDDTADAPPPGAMTSEFAVWYGASKDLKRGIYLYWFATKQYTLISERAPEPGSLQIGGRWVTFMTPTRMGGPNWAVDSLFAYNVDTRQTVQIADDAFAPSGGVGTYLSINEDMVAWIRSGRTVLEVTLNVYDLRQGTRWQVPTKLENPLPRLRVSRTAVIWQDFYWKGYDLANGALFTVPVVPPGVDRAAIMGGSRVTGIHGNTLEWDIAFDGQNRHFTGTLTEKGPSASASAQSLDSTVSPVLDMTATPPATPLPTDTPLPPPTDTAVPFATATALPTATAIPSASRLSVSPAQQAVQAGQTFTVALQLNADRPSRAVQVAASFNLAVIHCDTASEGDMFQSWAASHGGGRLYFPAPTFDNVAGRMSDLGLALIPTETVPVNATPGPDYYPPDATFTRLGGVRGLGTLVTLHCTALAAGVSPITVSGVKLYNDYANPGRLEVAVDNGQVFVGVTPTPTP